MDAFEILVVILSVTLAIFLILSIVAVSMLIYILKKAKLISEHAEVIAENLETASNKFRNFAGPAAVLSILPKLLKLRKK
jgi:hypothetical protein